MKSRIVIEWEPTENLEAEKKIASDLHIQVRSLLRMFCAENCVRPVQESVITKVSYTVIKKLAMHEDSGDCPL